MTGKLLLAIRDLRRDRYEVKWLDQGRVHDEVWIGDLFGLAQWLLVAGLI